MFILSQIVSLPLERRAERMFSNCLATTWNGKGAGFSAGPERNKVLGQDRETFREDDIDDVGTNTAFQ
jgi:hypothetical protein